MKKFVFWVMISMVVCGSLSSCKKEKKNAPAGQETKQETLVAPPFDADSAFHFVKAQTDFGPRVPNTTAHDRCGEYLQKTLAKYADTLYVQSFSAKNYKGTQLRGKNIIGVFNPDQTRRVILASHWDSRHVADHDPDPAHRTTPIDGANDGASGVGVLLEIARQLSEKAPNIGVDIIFFDLEDPGTPENETSPQGDWWCLGSQHWASNPHTPCYSAVYGILFDMVGTADGPRFTKEQVSRTYAPGLTDKLWSAAAALGHGTMFVNSATDPILDDHLYVNQILGIPMVDIVQNSAATSFFTHWHTTSDDLAAISPRTLEAVATVVLKTIYADYPHED